jgi:ribose transport system permease protein
VKARTRALRGKTTSAPSQAAPNHVTAAKLVRVRLVLGTSNSSLGLVLLIVASWTIFGLGGSGFLSSFNLYSVGQLAARDAVLGMAQAALVVIARMNLAVGSIGAICASLLGYLLVSASVPLPLALVAVCVVGILASLLMGIVELRSGLSSFIVTLAFLSAYGGAALLVTGAQQYEITSKVLNRLGNGSLFVSSLCPLVAVALVCGVLVWLLYTRNGLGWRMLAVGSNEQAARVSGVNVRTVVLASYAISGLLCAIAAIMESSYQLNVNAGVGSDWLLPSFIAPVLGGLALTGGDISVIGILLAALFYDSLQSGLTILNVPSYWLELAEGLVLLVAVVLDQLRHSRRRSARYRPTEIVAVLAEEPVA